MTRVTPREARRPSAFQRRILYMSYARLWDIARRAGVGSAELARRRIAGPALKRGMMVEAEHGSLLDARLDVTHDDLVATARIALAHLFEAPDYYDQLERLQERSKDK